METLPFHNHVEFEDNDEDRCGKPKNSKEIKEEICDYSPIKIDCLWFEDKIPADNEEELTVTKFKAHCAYRRQDYIKAISLYDRCHELLPANANLLLREVGESKARCLLKVGRYKDCEELLASLLDEKGNPQDSSLKSLLSDVYMALGRLEDAASNLRQCLTLHPEYTQYWIRLSDIFEELAKSSKYFLEHFNRESDKEFEILSDIWYFVDVLKKSFLTEDIAENKEKRHLEQKNGLNISDFIEREWLSLLQKQVDISACKDTIESVLEKWNDLSITQCANSMKSYDIRDCKCFQSGLTPSALVINPSDDCDEETSPFSNDCLLLKANVLEGMSSQVHRPIITHFLSWYFVMTMAHWFALGKAWQSLRKTVQYSKGFAKRTEQKTLTEIEERMLASTGCEKVTNWLMKISLHDRHMQNLDHL